MLSMKICKCFISHNANVSNFHPLDIVDRDSETQYQVDNKLNTMMVLS